MPQKIIIANWKMNPTSLSQAEALITFLKKEIKPLTKKMQRVRKDNSPLKNIKAKSEGINLKSYSFSPPKNKIKIIICPPYLYLDKISKKLTKSSLLELGAQDCSLEREGAFTGEISPTMLKNIGCKWVILGHSERRNLLEETSALIAKKIKMALIEKLNIVLCIGENQKFNPEEIQKQMRQSLDGLEPRNFSLDRKLYIAYEPKQNIGTGITPDSNTLMQAFLIIKKTFIDKFGIDKAGQIKLLYGGSVTSKEIEKLEQAQPDGYLIGGASLDAFEFSNIIKELINK